MDETIDVIQCPHVRKKWNLVITLKFVIKIDQVNLQ